MIRSLCLFFLFLPASPKSGARLLFGPIGSLCHSFLFLPASPRSGARLLLGLIGSLCHFFLFSPASSRSGARLSFGLGRYHADNFHFVKIPVHISSHSIILYPVCCEISYCACFPSHGRSKLLCSFHEVLHFWATEWCTRIIILF